MLALIFDTETTSMVNFREEAGHSSQPWPCEVAWELFNVDTRTVYASFASLVRVPEDVEFHADAVAVNGITREMARRHGFDPVRVWDLFQHALRMADVAVCHSWNYDRRVMTTMGIRMGITDYSMKQIPNVCTMMSTTSLCKIRHARGGRGYKWPKLEEAYLHVTGKAMPDGAHSAAVDVAATREILSHLVDDGHVNLVDVVQNAVRERL